MDGRSYLKSYGWQEGEGLRKGSLKKPILVKYKRDKKGLGGGVGHNDGEAWWERLFDGHLKNLDVSTDSNSDGEIVFKQNKAVATSVRKESSPLYQWFVKGEGLKGTLKEDKPKVEKRAAVTSTITLSKKRKRRDDDDDVSGSKKSKKSKDKKSKDKKSKDKKSRDKKSKDKKSKDKKSKDKKSRDKKSKDKKSKDKKSKDKRKDRSKDKKTEDKNRKDKKNKGKKSIEKKSKDEKSK
ncbi:Tma23p RNJ42_03350 [Nakaseomyces bracarensis]|uniref:Tma23p n=1 Tax=Nakaseomyces bracarensis TaxID=273131 RepID=UPI0038710CFA